MTLSAVIKLVSKRSRLSYKTWAEKSGLSTDGVITTVIVRNNCNVATLVKLANAAGYDVLLVRRHAFEYEEPIVIDCAGKEKTGDGLIEKKGDSHN